MSRSRGPLIHYRCINDCVQSGCPGHTMQEIHCRSTDTYSFEVDGKPTHFFDEYELSALLKAHAGEQGTKPEER